jgi:AraC-like DNA-binding protein
MESVLHKSKKTDRKIAVLPFFDFGSAQIWNRHRFDSDCSLVVPENIEPLIVFVLAGSISLEAPNEGAITVKSGETVLLSPCGGIRFETVASTIAIFCRFSAEILYARQEAVSEMTKFVDRDSSFLKKLTLTKTIQRYLLLLNQYIDDGLLSEHLSEMKRSELLILLLAYYEKPALAQYFRYFLTGDVNFIKFIVDNHIRANNVIELAEIANYSVSGFIKKFRKAFGQPPYQWLQQQKARRILEELSRGEKSLQVIAAEFNFSSYQHFATFCQRKFKLPPSGLNNGKISKKNAGKNDQREEYML